MRRVIKSEGSLILVEDLKYTNIKQRKKIAEELLKGQENFCAYTETYLAARTDAMEIDHFNPTLKNTDADGYQNWFLVKAQWNKEKSDKWARYQPIMHPTDDNFKNRIVYHNGYYEYDIEDIEAKNLCNLLKLNDPELAKERIDYIDRIRSDIEDSGKMPIVFINELYLKWPERLYFCTAIEAEFSLDLFQ